MKLSLILAPMLAAKVPHEVIMETVLAFEAQQTDALEQRRASDRDRQARKRLSRDITGCHAGSHSHTRVEDSSSKEEISRKKERKEVRSQATRLPTDWQAPDEWLAEAIAAGMTRSQALASAARMHNWSLSDPKGKKLDWRATWRNWFQRDLPKPHSTASPPQPRNAGELARLRLNGTIDNEPGTRKDDRRLDAGNGERQAEGTGIARRFAITTDILGRVG